MDKQMYLTTTQLSERWHCTMIHVRTLLTRTPMFHPVKIGRKLLVLRREVEAYENTMKVGGQK
jgi:hypothetical protein